MRIEPRELPRQAPPEIKTLAAQEEEYIKFVLNRCNGNVSVAARWLGLHRQSLQRKLRKIGYRPASCGVRRAAPGG